METDYRKQIKEAMERFKRPKPVASIHDEFRKEADEFIDLSYKCGFRMSYPDTIDGVYTIVAAKRKLYEAIRKTELKGLRIKYFALTAITFMACIASYLIILIKVSQLN